VGVGVDVPAEVPGVLVKAGRFAGRAPGMRRWGAGPGAPGAVLVRRHAVPS
jgi:hypothetical protein